MANEPRDNDRTREEGTYTKDSEETVHDESGTHTKETYTKDTMADDDYDETMDTERYDENRTDTQTGYDENRTDTQTGYDENRTDTHAGDDDEHPGLLWFSVAGAIIMGTLWIIDITGLFGLTWTVLSSTTTLAIAILAAVGAVLFWYDNAKSDDTTTA